MLKRMITSIAIAALSTGMGCATTQSGIEQKSYTRAQKARMLVEIANGSLVEKDPTGALQSLAKAEIQDDGLPELYHSRALAYYLKNDRDAALVAAKRATQIKPDYSDANNTLGKIYMDLNQPKKASKYLNLAANDPLYREAFKPLSNLGILSYRDGHYAKAKSYFDRAIQEAPQAACIAYYYRGHIQMKAHEVVQAVQDYSRATKKTCGDYGDAYLALGLAYLKTRQYPLARSTFVEIQKRYPNTQLAKRALDQLKYLP